MNESPDNQVRRNMTWQSAAGYWATAAAAGMLAFGLAAALSQSSL